MRSSPNYHRVKPSCYKEKPLCTIQKRILTSFPAQLFLESSICQNTCLLNICASNQWTYRNRIGRCGRTGSHGCCQQYMYTTDQSDLMKFSNSNQVFASTLKIQEPNLLDTTVHRQQHYTILLLQLHSPKWQERAGKMICVLRICFCGMQTIFEILIEKFLSTLCIFLIFLVSSNLLWPFSTH